MVRLTGVEPASLAYKASALAVELQPQTKPPAWPGDYGILRLIWPALYDLSYRQAAEAF